MREIMDYFFKYELLSEFNKIFLKYIRTNLVKHIIEKKKSKNNSLN